MMDTPPEQRISRWLTTDWEALPIVPEDGIEFTLGELHRYVWLEDGDLVILPPANSDKGWVVIAPQKLAYLAGLPFNGIATEVLSRNRKDRLVIPVHGNAVLAWKCHLPSKR